MRPITKSLNLQNTSATSVAAAQQVAINGFFVLAAGANPVDTSGAARYLLLTTGENDSSGNAVIIGTDADGNVITETTAWPSTSTVSSAKAYATVTSIQTTIAITTNASVGTLNTTATAISPTIPLNFKSRTGAQVAAEVTGTINFSIRETFDDVLGAGTAKAVWFAPSALATKTANTTAALDVAATGCDILINSYSNGATITIRVINTESDVG